MTIVELIPKALVVGFFAPVQPGPNPPVTHEKITRIWAEVAPTSAYRQLQVAPDGSAAQFLGDTPDEGASIQLPLVQVRSRIGLTVDQSIDQTYMVMKAIARHLSLTQVFNIGVKQVFHGLAPDNDARTFVLNRILSKSEDELGELQAGEGLWGGVKFVAPTADGAQYALTIEPLQADNKFIFIDLDVQFPGGPWPIDAVKERAKDAENYMSGAVRNYLDRVGDLS
jgi:hypothetical protein